MILEQVQGTRECLWPICTGSISNISILDIRSVMFPVDHGYVGDGATGSWWISLIKDHEWCFKTSDRKIQWKPVELTTQNGSRHIRHLGTISGSLVPKMGIRYRIWDLVLFWRLKTISGILALYLEYRSWNFDTCSRGRPSLKVISVCRVTYSLKKA